MIRCAAGGIPWRIFIFAFLRDYELTCIIRYRNIGENDIQYEKEERL